MEKRVVRVDNGYERASAPTMRVKVVFMVGGECNISFHKRLCFESLMAIWHS